MTMSKREPKPLRAWLAERGTAAKRRRLGHHRPQLKVETLEHRELLNAALRFDFGPVTAPVQAGYVQVTEATAYSTATGYGWLGGWVQSVDRAYGSDLNRDFIYSHDATFGVDLPDGTYSVAVTLGDAAYPHDNMGILVNGQQVTQVTVPAGQFYVWTFSAQATGGRLVLEMRDQGGNDPNIVLNALEITPTDAPTPPATPPALPDQMRFDFGPTGMTAAAGFIAVTDASAYTSAQKKGGAGFGWLNGVIESRDRGVGTAPNRDFVFTRDGTLGIDVPNGTYSVTVTMGDATTMHDQMGVFLNGQQVDSVTSQAGEYVKRTYTTQVSKGRLDVRLRDLGGSDDNVVLNALEIGLGDVPTAPPVAQPPVTPPSPPTAVLSNSGTVNEGGSASVSFANASGGSGGYTYSYDFNNDGVFEITGSAQATVAVPAANLADGPATLVVRGRIKDGAGLFTDYTTSITVQNVAPTANAGGPYTGLVGAAIAFQGSATDPSPADTAAGFTYSWNFGDGTTGTGSSVSHTYSISGPFTASLTVRDKDGGTTTTTASVAVAAPFIPPPAPVPTIGGYIVTAFDKIPDFGANVTVTAIRSGRWSDATIWSTGALPVAGDVVNIGAFTDVVYDVVSDLQIKTVEIKAGGSLRFRTDVSTRLTVINLLVLEGGELQIGTAGNPVAATVKAEVVFPDVALDLVNDPAQYGNGLIALGKVTIYGATKSDTFIRLAAEPLAGATTLTLAAPVTGWRVGDRLELPDTRMLYAETAPDTSDVYASQRELMTVAAISADGRTVTLSQALQFDHKGARDGDGVLTFAPHVANLTRNVVIRSANARGVRGHTLFTARADVDIHYAQFSALGRTTNEVLDNTTFNGSGGVTHAGTNQTGRYSVNFHNLVGPTSSQSSGYQFTFQGNAVFCPLDPMPFRWGIALHNSSYGLIKDNVLYNWAGGGIVADTGTEVNNLIANNLITRISQYGRYMSRGDAREMRDLAFEGAGLWFRGPSNYVRDNVVSEARYGYLYFAYNEASAVRIPLTQGADPSAPGQFQTVWYNQQPLLEFARNEVYGGWTNVGMTIWALGNQGGVILNPNQAESVVKDFRAWNIYGIAYYNYETDHLTLDGMVVRGDWSLMLHGIFVGAGVISGDYVSRNFKIINSDIQGLRLGFDAGITGGTEQIIENSYLRNYIDVQISPQYFYGGPHAVQPRTTTLRNVRFGRLNVEDKWDLPPQTFIYMNGVPGSELANYVARDNVFVYAYNGVAGDNFQLFYREQAANAVVPTSTFFSDGRPLSIGSPVAGLTNAQTMQQFGVAFAGSIAPASSTTRSDIAGLINRI